MKAYTSIEYLPTKCINIHYGIDSVLVRSEEWLLNIIGILCSDIYTDGETSAITGDTDFDDVLIYYGCATKDREGSGIFIYTYKLIDFYDKLSLELLEV